MCLVTLGPGGLFVVESPSDICDHLGNNVNGPCLMTLTRSTIPVWFAVARLPQVKVSESNNLTYQRGFWVHNTKVTLRSLNFVEPKCPGKSCDAIGCYENGVLSTTCSCYSKTIADAQIVAWMDLLLQSDGPPNKVSVRYFTSKKATFFFSGMRELAQGSGPPNSTSFASPLRVARRLRMFLLMWTMVVTCPN